jgi:hypothetical protein
MELPLAMKTPVPTVPPRKHQHVFFESPNIQRTDSDELQVTARKLPLELVTLGCLLLLEVARRIGNGLA